MISRLFDAGADVFRINMSHTAHDKMRELVDDDPRREAEYQPADRHPGRFAGTEVAARQLHERLGRDRNGAGTSSSTADPAPGDATRVHLPHPEIFAAIKPGDTLLIDDGKLRLVCDRSSAAAHRRARRGRRQSVEPQGRQPAGHRRAGCSAGARRISPTSKPRSTPASTGWRCRSSSARRTSPRRRRSPAAAPR